MRSIYDRILAESRKFGSVIEEPKKTSIHLVNKSAFAGVVTRKNTLILNYQVRRAYQAQAFFQIRAGLRRAFASGSETGIPR